MDLLRHLVFENPLTLWMTLGLACLVAALIWSRTGSRRALWTLGALLAAVVAVGIAAWAVETDRERVERTLRIMAKAAEAGDAEAMVERISERYPDRPALVAVVRRGLAQVRATAGTTTIRMEDGRATITQEYVFRSVRPGLTIPAGRDRVTWEGVFEPDADGQWRLVGAMAIRPVRVSPVEAARVLK